MAEMLGIDLGTTNSVVAVWHNGKPEVVPNAEGETLTPSVVAVNSENGDILVGRPARALAQQSPRSVVYSVKRFMGRRFSDEEVKQSLKHLHILYEIREQEQTPGTIEIALGGKRLTPQDLSATILQKLKMDAEGKLGHVFREAVITVPAYFHDSQRQATRDAGRIAGLDVRRVLNEPTAACLAFGYNRLAEQRRTVAVYDLGGGTFDISILDVGRGPFRVRSTSGDTYLGGDDLDWAIVDWAITQIGGRERDKLREDTIALSQLRLAAEHAKIALSSEASTQLNIPGRLSPASSLHDITLDLKLEDLEAMAQPLVARTLEPCRRAMADAKLQPQDIDEVLLVGGQTRMPAVRRAVQEYFGIEPNSTVNPDEIVALGAAVQGAILAGEATGLKLADVVPLSLGVSTKGEIMDILIPRNTLVPTREITRVYSTAWENQESVEVQVYQGENPMVKYNQKLAAFQLRGIEPAPAGEPEIAVTFRMDQDGILCVSAQNRRTTASAEITVTDSLRLSQQEMDAAILAANEHAADYAAERRVAEEREIFEQLRERLRKLLVERQGNLRADLVAAVTAALTVPIPDDLSTLVRELKELCQRVNDAGTPTSVSDGNAPVQDQQDRDTSRKARI